MSVSRLATARSRKLSPSKRPDATNKAEFHILMVAGVAGSSVPSPFPKSIETVEEAPLLKLTTARSILVSLLKSRTTIENGKGPTPTVAGVAAPEVPSTFSKVWRRHCEQS